MKERLEKLGLRIAEGPAGMQAVLTMEQLPLLNPLTRRPLKEITFSVAGERLVAIHPPELVGITPIAIKASKRPRLKAPA